MRTIPTATFMGTMRDHDIGPHPQYPGWTRDLTFLKAQGIHRYWRVPSERIRATCLLREMVNALGPWKELFFWSRIDNLYDSVEGEEHPVYDRVLRNRLLAPFIARNGEAIVCDRSELSALLDVLVVMARFGRGTLTDAFIVPDSFDAILMIDHHGVVHANCSSVRAMDRYTAELAAHGFILDRLPPDGTFAFNPDGTKTQGY